MIVTGQRTMRDAVLIGSLWGIGHTLTIITVGGAIILFSVVIPPSLGLTMEMAVALMLVVLGMWNLTGIVRWIPDTFMSGRERARGPHAHLQSHSNYFPSHPHRHE